MRALLAWLAACLTLNAAGQRIASYSPGATQTLLDLGCSEEIVMATRWCPLPKDHPAARDADVFLPDLERLLRTKPDLVILPRMANPLWAEKCAKAGLRTILLHAEARDSVRRDITLLGEATGRTLAAKTLTGLLNGGPEKRARKIVIVWDGVMSGPDSYLAEPLAHAGLCSALTQGAWVKFDWELLASAQPDAVLWIINAAEGTDPIVSPGKITEMSGIPGVKDLACIKKRHVYQVNSGGNWLPGSGLRNAMKGLSRIRGDVE
jgi:ABC-type Fe3+-hydroxamate transport system substrate-binding protein